MERMPIKLIALSVGCLSLALFLALFQKDILSLCTNGLAPNVSLSQQILIICRNKVIELEPTLKVLFVLGALGITMIGKCMPRRGSFF